MQICLHCVLLVPNVWCHTSEIGPCGLTMQMWFTVACLFGHFSTLWSWWSVWSLCCEIKILLVLCGEKVNFLDLIFPQKVIVVVFWNVLIFFWYQAGLLMLNAWTNDHLVLKNCAFIIFLCEWCGWSCAGMCMYVVVALILRPFTVAFFWQCANVIIKLCNIGSTGEIAFKFDQLIVKWTVF